MGADATWMPCDDGNVAGVANASTHCAVCASTSLAPRFLTQSLEGLLPRFGPRSGSCLSSWPCPVACAPWSPSPSTPLRNSLANPAAGSLVPAIFNALLSALLRSLSTLACLLGADVLELADLLIQMVSRPLRDAGQGALHEAVFEFAARGFLQQSCEARLAQMCEAALGQVGAAQHVLQACVLHDAACNAPRQGRSQQVAEVDSAGHHRLGDRTAHGPHGSALNEGACPCL